MTPHWTIITPSYLGPYKQAGANREDKLLRCVSSVLNQNYGLDFEQIIIADGCDMTVELIRDNFADEINDGIIRLVKIQKQKMFSGAIRNTGIELATGQWITYLDSDDIYGPEHLEVIDQQLNGYDWVFFNDMIYDNKGFTERTCHLKQYHCGTSNVAHRRDLAVRWTRGGYGRDDWDFIQTLKQTSQNWAKIETPEYIVCHIPLKTGYDL